MKDISDFKENDRYKLYDVSIIKSKKKDDLWFATKKYVTLKEIADNRFHTLQEEHINDKPVTTGYFWIEGNSINAIEDFENLSNNQKYELTVLRDEQGHTIVEKGVKVNNKKEVIAVNVSPIRKTKEKEKNYVFLTVSIKEDELDNAPNREEIIEGFRRKGLKFQKEPHRNYYQFNTIVFPSVKQMAMFETYAKQTVHLEVFVQEKENNFDLQRVGLAVFAKGSLKVNGIVAAIDGEMLEIHMLTNWEKLNEGNNKNIIHFTSTPRETLSEPTVEGDTIQLTFKVKAVGGFKGEIGDEVSFELNEDNVKKVLSPKIAIDFNEGNEKSVVDIKEQPSDTVGTEAPKETAAAATPPEEKKSDKDEEVPF